MTRIKPIDESRKTEMQGSFEPHAARALARLPAPGQVFLVGAGPGDPELLTVRALKLLQRADVVLYDHLVSEAVLDCLRPEAERIYVGKQDRRHTMPQASITALLVRVAQSGRSVVRLKGGDPYVFGRGGEEAEALAAAGIPFEVVPGISAAQGMSAYAGIPLTHREHAASVVFATGHAKEGGDEPDWAALARPRQTVVFYMGVGALPRICRELVAHGLRADTPAAVVENATCASQRTVTGTLLTLPALAAAQAVQSPALVVVGSVVTLHRQLGWFEPAAQGAMDMAAPA